MIAGKRLVGNPPKLGDFHPGYFVDFPHCAARAFYDCPAIIRLRPRSQNILKEPHLNPEEDSRIKRARSHVSLEKSS